MPRQGIALLAAGATASALAASTVHAAERATYEISLTGSQRSVVTRDGTTTDASGRLAVDGAERARFACELAELGDRTDGRAVVGHSVRNRFSGLVSRVLRDTVMAQVEIQAGPHRFVSLLSREAADELGLEPGVLAVAAIKATNVSVEIPAIR